MTTPEKDARKKALLLQGRRAAPAKPGAAPAEPDVVPAKPDAMTAEVISPTVAPTGELPALPALPTALGEAFTHLSERQFDWLSWRLGTATDDEACEAAEIDPAEVLVWRGDPAFEAVYQRALENKREAFRVLGTHMLPKALRVINRLLESSSFKANQAGLQLLLKTQALLDQPQKDQSEQVNRLLEALRMPGTVVPAEIRPRE